MKDPLHGSWGRSPKRLALLYEDCLHEIQDINPYEPEAFLYEAAKEGLKFYAKATSKKCKSAERLYINRLKREFGSYVNQCHSVLKDAYTSVIENEEEGITENYVGIQYSNGEVIEWVLCGLESRIKKAFMDRIWNPEYGIRQRVESDGRKPINGRTALEIYRVVLQTLTEKEEDAISRKIMLARKRYRDSVGMVEDVTDFAVGYDENMKPYLTETDKRHDETFKNVFFCKLEGYKFWFIDDPEAKDSYERHGFSLMKPKEIVENGKLRDCTITMNDPKLEKIGENARDAIDVANLRGDKPFEFGTDGEDPRTKEEYEDGKLAVDVLSIAEGGNIDDETLRLMAGEQDCSIGKGATPACPPTMPKDEKKSKLYDEKPLMNARELPI